MGTKERPAYWRPRVLLLLRVFPCLFVALLGGCHRRPVVPPLPAVVQAPVPPPPTPTAPAMKSPPPASLSTAPAVKVTEVKPKSRPRRSAQKIAPPAPAPAETVAAVAPPETAALGELSAGGDSSPKSQQEASELIVSSERRLDALGKTKAKPPDDQTREVRHFLQQAREALATGDAEGARTLATKAKLLMDDLEKWAQR
jgi:hypothetical protein